MKLSVILLSILGVAIAIPHRLETQNLQNDLQEFANFYIQDDILEIISAYFNCDEKLIAFGQFLQSDDFREFSEAFVALPEFIELRQFFQDFFFDYFDKELTTAARSLEASRAKRSIDDGIDSPNCDLPITGGFRGFFHDILSAIPIEEIKTLFFEKLETSPEFRAFIDKLRSEEFKSIIQRLKANPDFRKLLFKAKADIEALIVQLQSAIGVQYY